MLILYLYQRDPPFVNKFWRLLRLEVIAVLPTP